MWCNLDTINCIPDLVRSSHEKLISERTFFWFTAHIYLLVMTGYWRAVSASVAPHLNCSRLQIISCNHFLSKNRHTHRDSSTVAQHWMLTFLAQHEKRGGSSPPPLTILPAHSSPHLLNNERSLVSGALSLLSLNDSRLCKIYYEYKICNMQYVKGGSCRTGWVWFNVYWLENPPPLIPDRISDVFPSLIEMLHAVKKRRALNWTLRKRWYIAVDTLSTLGLTLLLIPLSCVVRDWGRRILSGYRLLLLPRLWLGSRAFIAIGLGGAEIYFHLSPATHHRKCTDPLHRVDWYHPCHLFIFNSVPPTLELVQMSQDTSPTPPPQMRNSRADTAWAMAHADLGLCVARLMRAAVGGS